MVSEATQREVKISTAPAYRSTSVETLVTHDRDYVYINDMQINKEQFLYAFGGNLNPGETVSTRRNFGNPAPAGLCAFGMCCVTLGLINMQLKGITNSSILIGTCFFSAGIIELVCAIWCLILENTFAATVFFCFFGFWSSYGCILGNVLGLQDAYATTKEWNDALGLFTLLYVFFTFIIWICTLKSTWPFTILFFNIFLFVLLFDIAYFTQSVPVTKAGGFFCLLAGLLGLYNAFTGLSEPSNSYFTVKPLYMPGAARPVEYDVEKLE